MVHPAARIRLRLGDDTGLLNFLTGHKGHRKIPLRLARDIPVEYWDSYIAEGTQYAEGNLRFLHL